MATVKHSLPLVLSALVIVMLAMLMAVPSRADDVTFFDSTETLTAGTTGSRITIPACGFTTTDVLVGFALEGCTATLSAPSGSVFTGASFNSLVLIGESDGTISDAILVDAITTDTATITFLSDPSEVGLPIPCSGSAVGTCTITEDGTVQFAGSISWTDDTTGAVTTDNISFQSDVDAPVPEPASLTLLGSGFLAVVGYIRRRRAGVISAARTESNLA